LIRVPRDRRLALALFLLFVIAGGFVAQKLAGDRLARLHPPATELTPAAFEDLKRDFNATANQTRLLVLLSPT
jgi:hypothetical protein